MIELSLQNINKYFGATKVFDSISFELHSNSRVGLIGRNGTGKTTIFKIIAGVEHANEGSMTFRKGSTVGYLDQIPEYIGHTAIDVLRLAFKDLLDFEKDLKKYEEKLADYEDKDYENTLKIYGDMQAKFEHGGGYEINEQVERICSGFKFTKDFLGKDFEILSGGEKTRIILAKILLEKPSILLLDEPSNHLDIESVEWLEEYLKDYEGCVLIISHDRYFLDNTVTEIHEIDGGRTHRYLGNYTYYVKEKERRVLEQLEIYKQQQKKIKAMEEAIKRFRDWGSRVENEKMFIKAKAMQKRIDRMDKVDRPKTNQKKMGLEFNQSDRSGKDVVTIRDLYKSYDNNDLFIDAQADVKYQDFVALLGRNGSGKTTLLRMILGSEGPDSGLIKLAESAKVGYMEQEIKFEEPEKSVLSTFKDKYALTELDARNKLARFLFYSDDVFKIVKNLSGGEKVRLSLCMMMEEEINFLILDEPTNHVDIDSREMIEQALRNFKGTILFISHDRYFIDQLANKVIRVEDKLINTYHGDYRYFREEYEKEQIKRKEAPQITEKKNVKEVKEKTSDNKGLSIFKQKELDQLEIDMELKENVILNLEKSLLDNSRDYGKLVEIQSDIDSEKETLDEMMNKWMSYQ